MRLWALRCGDLHTDVGSLVGDGTRGVTADVPIMCFAVDTNDGIAVFDTGLHEACCGPDPAAHFGGMWSTFEIRCPRQALVDERLRQVGCSGDDVRWVVNSHLHFDHVGRNVAFPAATQYVRHRELSWARDASTHRWSGVLPGDLADVDAPAWDYDDEFPLCDGLRLISTPGHTPGHQAMVVSFPDDRRFVCSGDAAYTLQAVVEHQPTGRPCDAQQAAKSLRTITALDAEILTSHDVEQWRHVHDAELVHSA